MPRRLALVLVATLLLAGCASSPSGDEMLQAASTTTTSTVPPVPALPPVPAPQTQTCDGVRSNAGTSAGLGLYVDRAVTDSSCFFEGTFSDLSWARSTLVEVEWTPQPGMTAGDAWFESDDCASTPLEPCDLPKEASASSPLSMALEGEEFLEHIDANLEVQVAVQGAAAQQAFRVHLTLFANATVDAGFTAIP